MPSSFNVQVIISREIMNPGCSLQAAPPHQSSQHKVVDRLVYAAAINCYVRCADCSAPTPPRAAEGG